MVPAGRAVFSLSNIIAGAIFILLSGVVLKRGSESSLLKRWSIFCLFAGLFGLFVAVATLTGDPATGLWANRIGMTSAVLALFFFMRFTFVLGNPVLGQRALNYIGLVWAAILVPMFIFTNQLFKGVEISAFSANSPVPGRLMPLYLLYLLYTWAVSLTMAIRAYKQEKGVKKSQAAYVLLGIGIAFFSTTGSVFPIVFNTRSLVATLPHLFLPVFPLIITYAIVKHRLWEIRTVVHRTLGWVLALSIFMAPLYGILWLYSYIGTGMSRFTVVLLLSTTFVVFYAYIRTVKPRLDRLFLRRAFDRQSLLDEFEKDMTVLSDKKQVVKRLVHVIYQGVMPEWTKIEYLPDSGETLAVEVKGTIPEPALNSHGPGSDLLEKAGKMGIVIEKGHMAADQRLAIVRDAAARFLEETGSSVFSVLFHAGRVLGYITLGEKKNLRPYSKEDLDYLELLSSRGSIALSNAVLFGTVDRQRRDLEKLARELESRVNERTRDLSQANERLRDLDKLKSRFFANISHELRTPLTLILVPVESMLEDASTTLDDTLKEQLEGVRMSALKLLKLIDDLLDLSRLEEARLKLKLDLFDVCGLVRKVSDFSRPLALRKNIDLSCDATGEIVIEADETKLEKVFVNLLSNALKFTEPGGSIKVRVQEKAEHGAVLVGVEDTGIGIPDNEIDLVFNRFHQVDDSSTKRHYGSGLGLALVKELIELHCGNITVESELGKGSRFDVELPLRADQVPQESIEKRVRQEPVVMARREADSELKEWSDEILARPEYRFLDLKEATERRLVPRQDGIQPKAARLLVVDDNPQILKYLNNILRDQYDVWSAQDGEKALELLVKHRHDLVIADIMMPKISGIELCQRIKREPKLQDIPVVLLTARQETEHKIQGHKAGADLYIGKPFKKKELLAGVENLLKNRFRRTEVAARRRAASLETLLSGMAHELRNAAHQLQNAHRALVSLVRHMADDKESSDMTRMENVAQRALTRINQVVTSLQQYSQGKMQGKWSKIDWDKLVKSSTDLICGSSDKKVNLVVDIGSNATVLGPREELRQTVINLVENSLQAVEEGGEILVSTRAESGRAVLLVQDNGPGIPEENRERVFDLFFTTKEPGKGMGIGLSLCKRIVQDLGGDIDLESSQGAGTKIRVVLPIAS
ncbi:MAG: response regulator [Deltaproteobacteria bacterium]|nr:response regulator [Deltaproteobacteria bacterium]